MIVLDSHCDTPSQIMRLRNLGLDNERGHVDFPKLKAGGVDASFFALFTPQTMAPDAATRYTLEMIAGVHDQVEANPDKVAMAYSHEDILKNKARGLVSILLGIENGLPVQKSLSLLREFHRMGVRYMTLTHNGDNEIADSVAGNGAWNGLSPFGREVVAEMNRLGMIIDMAHASDKTFFDTLECSSKPIVSTHSCCRALASHRRNMTDEMIKAMADKGGVIQINFYPVFLSDDYVRVLAESGLEPAVDKADKEFRLDPGNPEKIRNWNQAQDWLRALPRPGVEVVVDHIEHAVAVGGIEHVGIGTDYDGIDIPPFGLENVSMLGRVFDEMKRRSFSDDAIEKVAGANFLRVLDEVSNGVK
ncbi:MAG: dipeptidase [Bacteroidales bacterium]|nr:dipeptidase [Bacteroidales bacterium]